MATAQFNVSTGTTRVFGGQDKWPSWRNALAQGFWAEVGSNALSAIDPEDFPEFNPGYPSSDPWEGEQADSITAWCTMAWNETTLELYHAAQGGHTDYAGNPVNSIGLAADTPAWVMRKAPSGAVGNEITLNDSQESSAKYSDGAMRSSHSYNCQVVFDGDIYTVHVGACYRAGTPDTRRISKYLSSTEDWEITGQIIPDDAGFTPNAAGCAIVDSSRSVIWCLGTNNSYITRYTPATDTATNNSKFHNLGGQPINGFYYAPGDMLVVFESVGPTNGVGYIDDLDNQGANFTDLPVTGTVPSFGGQDGVVWDSNSDRVLIWNGGTDLDVLTPPGSSPKVNDWTFSVLADDVSNTVDPGTAATNGTFGRFFFSAHLDCVGVINAVTQKLHVLALS